MVEMKSLVQGAKVVALVILAIIGAYAIAILGGIIIGVLVQVVVGGINTSNFSQSGSSSINVSDAMVTAIEGYETTYISTITTSLTPLVTIAALVIVVVLILIFFGRGGFNFGKDRVGK